MAKKSKRRAWFDRCAHFENRRQEEDTGGKHCPNVEADRGGYASKGI
jgi:hypothetical protein